jgi:nicotinate phosphoribosyltransferase
MRRPVVCAPRLALDWLRAVERERGAEVRVELAHQEGDWVGAGEPMMYLEGSFRHLVDLETILLQKLGAGLRRRVQRLHDVHGPALRGLPRHGRAPLRRGGDGRADGLRGERGSERARKETGAKGFIGNATDATAGYFGQKQGLGTMPHALIGYAGSTVRAAEMYREAFPDEPITVLVDFFGREVTDSLAVCERFPDLAAAGRLAVRLDTHGGRYLEGLDVAASYDVLERHVPLAIRTYRTEEELRWLTGTGVTAAAIFHMRERLDVAGFTRSRSSPAPASGRPSAS